MHFPTQPQPVMGEPLFFRTRQRRDGLKIQSAWFPVLTVPNVPRPNSMFSALQLCNWNQNYGDGHRLRYERLNMSYFFAHSLKFTPIKRIYLYICLQILSFTRQCWKFQYRIRRTVLVRCKCESEILIYRAPYHGTTVLSSAKRPSLLWG